MQFHGVEARLLGTAGPGGEGGDDGFDVGLIHGLGHRSPSRNRRRRHAVGTLGVAAGVMDLKHRLGPPFLDRRGKSCKPRNKSIVIVLVSGQQRARVAKPARLDGGVFHHHHAHARVGHFGVVVEHQIVHLVVGVSVRQVHRQADQAVFEPQLADAKRCEEKVGHGEAKSLA